MTQDSIDRLVAAIITKTQVRCTYDGHERILSPHIYGTKEGSRRFLAVQTGGSSRTGLGARNEDRWLCVHIDSVDGEIHNDDAPWQTAPNHSLPNTCVDETLAVVDFR